VNRRRLFLHQVGLEQRAFWRNPQSAFFTFAMPIGLLLIFGSIAGHETVPGRPGVRALALLVPGFLAFGIIVAAYGNLAGTVAMLRADGVLKRIRATPLQPGMYLAGQLGSVLATSLVIAVSSVALGRLAFGVAPRAGGALLLAGGLTLGVVCFASLGLAITAAIPTADAAGPVTNGTYVPLAIISGTFSDRLVLPRWLDHVVSALPVKAFTETLRAGYDPTRHALPIGNLAVLAVWAVIGIVLARRYFRWDP
jgi:ABC-2 type transport system permease protein